MRDEDTGRTLGGERVTDDESDDPGPTARTTSRDCQGMDLVRRTLEEARGAARSQGKDVGRGRTSPATRAGWRAGAGAGRGRGPMRGTPRRSAR